MTLTGNDVVLCGVFHWRFREYPDPARSTTIWTRDTGWTLTRPLYDSNDDANVFNWLDYSSDRAALMAVDFTGPRSVA